MCSSFTFGVTPEAKVFTFKKRGGESLKDAWYRINDSQKRATKKQSTTILLRNFYVGITSWNRFVLDTAINGNFIEAPISAALNVIENLVVSGPVISVCKSRYNTVIWRAENCTHLSKQARPST